jgi:hypothetical protein
MDMQQSANSDTTTQSDTPIVAPGGAVDTPTQAGAQAPPAALTIEEMKAAMRDKFSEEEIEKFLDMGKSLSCKPVITELINVIKAKPGFDSRGKKLVRDIEDTMEYKTCGHVKIPMKDEFGSIFNAQNVDIGLSLSITKKEHMPSFDCPEFIANAVLEQYKHMISTACAYWAHWCQKNSKLFKRVCDYRPDVDFSRLHNEATRPIMMYFTEESDTRICVFAYYFNNKTNQILVRNPQLREGL